MCSIYAHAWNFKSADDVSFKIGMVFPGQESADGVPRATNVGPRNGKSLWLSPIARGYLWVVIPKNPKVEHNKYHTVRGTPVLVP